MLSQIVGMKSLGPVLDLCLYLRHFLEKATMANTIGCHLIAISSSSLLVESRFSGIGVGNVPDPRGSLLTG